MRFRPNPRLAEHLRQDPDLRRTLAERAEVAKDAASSIARSIRAPWMPARGGGDQIEVQVDGDDVRVINRDHAAHLQEWGSRNNPPHAPLRRGARAAGLRLDEH